MNMTIKLKYIFSEKACLSINGSLDQKVIFMIKVT